LSLHLRYEKLEMPQIEAVAKVAEEKEGEEDPSPFSSLLFYTVFSVSEVTCSFLTLSIAH